MQNDFRLRTLKALGWNEKAAKKYIARHKRPQHFAEALILFVHAFYVAGNSLQRALSREFESNVRNRKRIFGR